jgi:hypothetical protein
VRRRCLRGTDDHLGEADASRVPMTTSRGATPMPQGVPMTTPRGAASHPKGSDEVPPRGTDDHPRGTPHHPRGPRYPPPGVPLTTPGAPLLDPKSFIFENFGPKEGSSRLDHGVGGAGSGSGSGSAGSPATPGNRTRNIPFANLTHRRAERQPCPSRAPPAWSSSKSEFRNGTQRVMGCGVGWRWFRALGSPLSRQKI